MRRGGYDVDLELARQEDREPEDDGRDWDNENKARKEEEG